MKAESLEKAYYLREEMLIFQKFKKRLEAEKLNAKRVSFEFFDETQTRIGIFSVPFTEQEAIDSINYYIFLLDRKIKKLELELKLLGVTYD